MGSGGGAGGWNWGAGCFPRKRRRGRGGAWAGEWEVVLLVFALQKVGVWPVDAACVGPGLLWLVHDDEEEEQHM